MEQLTHIIEPNRLKLIWQSGGADRTKYTVGELVRSDDKVSLSYFRLSTDVSLASRSGFVGHPAFPLTRPVHHQNVMDIFQRRLPPSNRADFPVYLAKARLANFPSISTFALLGYTGAYLPHDGFSFAIDFYYENYPFQFMFEISGFRYYSGMTIEFSTLLNQFVSFVPEPDNPHDSNAVQVLFQGQKIGYVPRHYGAMLNYWLQHCYVLGAIERIDGTMLKPQVYLSMYVYSREAEQLT